MTNMIFADDSNYNMKFESLMCGAFNCPHKYCDPLGYTAQDAYSSFFRDDPLEVLRGKTMLTTAFGIIAFRFPEGDHIDQLKDLIERVISCEDMEEVPKIIDEGIAIGKTLGL